MDKDAYKLFIAIGTCHGLMQEHARQTRAHPSVKDVTHWLDVYTVENAFRLHEYVDAELSNGQAISWQLELTLTLNDFAVEANISRNDEHGQDVIVEIADCVYPTPEECSSAILEITRQLCSTNPL